jgi:hypothetical protein
LWSKQVAASLASTSNRTTRLAIGAGTLLLVAAASFAARQWIGGRFSEPSRVVEKVGGFDPLAEGFTIGHDVTGRIVENDSRTGFDAWRIITRTQGYYFHAFTTAQKRHALERGWRLAVAMKNEIGLTVAVVDFERIGRRFDIQVLRDGDREVVRLARQLEFVQSPAGQYHEYELVYDPTLKTADLWVDKVRRLTGYVGHGQFQENNKGLIFGGAVFKSDSGSSVFKSARFEINR